MCIALAYACTDEFHQTFVSGRTGTPVDVGVDAIGMAIAALLIRARRRPPAEPGIAGRGHQEGARSSLARLP